MSKTKKVKVHSHKVTVQDLIDGLNRAINDGMNPDAVILWTDTAKEGDLFCKKEGIPGGTVLLGLDDPDIGKGTLSVMPKRVSDILN